MLLRFIGTGDDRGIPIHGCQCHICRKARAVSNYQRLPACLTIKTDTQYVLIDAGTADLNTRLEAHPLDQVFLTRCTLPCQRGLIALGLDASAKPEIAATQSACLSPLLRDIPALETASTTESDRSGSTQPLRCHYLAIDENKHVAALLLSYKDTHLLISPGVESNLDFPISFISGHFYVILDANRMALDMPTEPIRQWLDQLNAQLCFITGIGHRQQDRFEELCATDTRFRLAQDDQKYDLEHFAEHLKIRQNVRPNRIQAKAR